MGLEAGRPCHHQQERRLGGHLLARVQQRPPDLALQGMGFVEDEDERPPRATRRQQRGQGLAPATELPSEPPDAGRERQGVRPQRRKPGGRHQAGRQPVQVRDRAGGEPHHVDVLAARLDLAAEPAQEGGLPVATGAGEHRVAGRPATDPQVGEEVEQPSLLRLPAREIRRKMSSPRNERIDRIDRLSPVHDASIANPHRCAERQRKIPGHPRAGGAPSRHARSFHRAPGAG